jgi:pimeloyl-ACP methyl ester carboxylesterase
MHHRARSRVLRLSGAAVAFISALAVMPGYAGAVTADPDAPTDTTKASAPLVVWDQCRSSVPDRGRCGHIRTAVDPLRPGLGMQRVGFEFYPRRDKGSPSLGTLVGHEGGPGYPSTGSRRYFLGLFKPLADRHSVLLVDQRGTGTSDPIRCTPLQRGARPYVQAVADCGEQLGARADTYSTAYAADDTAAVLDALGIDQIHLYGDSYGTFFAQTFALRHPDRLRTLTLDAAYPVSGQDPWWRDTNRAIRDALSRVCSRDARCAALPGSPVNRMRSTANELHRTPVVGEAFNGEGKPRRALLDGVNLALVTAYATYGTSIYRELDSAVRAFRTGYQAPLLRLVAENITKSYAGGNPVYYSSGQYVAVICSDYPQLWDVSLPVGKERQEQFRAEVNALRDSDPDDFDPFNIDDWIDSGWTEPRTCIGWPPPINPIPPELPGAVYPDVPTLVLSGDLDTVTSPEGGLDAASRFPNSTFVSVPNVGHVTALGDRQGCAAGIVRRFMRTGGTVGDTGCVSEYAPVRPVPHFVRTSDGLDPAVQGSEIQSSRADRRVVSGALFAAGDALTRWYVNYSGSGVGLAGGTFDYSGTSPISFRLRDLAFVRDVAVSGKVKWNRGNGQVRATLEVDGPSRRDGTIVARWNDWDSAASAIVQGTINGRKVGLSTPAP